MTDARRQEIHDRACLFWVQQELDRLPVSPRRLVARNRWGLVTYRRLAELHGLTVGDLTRACCSRDGFTVFNGRNCCIACNDAMTAGRVRFTLMHEIGHIVLEHLRRPDYALPWEPADPELETEASFFAGCVLAPAAAIRLCGLTEPGSLAAACGLSHEAAVRRLAEYALLPPREADLAVARRLAAYRKAAVRSRADMGAAEIFCDDDRIFPAM